MWRMFFWSIGIYACLLGAECLVVERAYLNRSQQQSTLSGSRYSGPVQSEIVVPDWTPWSLLAFGAITLIYTVTIPKRANGD